MTNTAYKVLEVKEDGSLVSAGRIPEPMKITYKIREKNYGKFPGSKIFVFQDFNDAFLYEKELKRSSFQQKFMIFRCKCENLQEVSLLPNVWAIGSGCHERHYIDPILNFWKNGKLNISSYSFLVMGWVYGGVYSTNYVFLEREER